MRRECLEGRALEGRNALPFEAEEVGGGEGERGGNNRLGLEELEDVHVAGVGSGDGVGSGELRVRERSVRGRSGFQHVAGVDGRDWWVQILLGCQVGPGVEELRCADAVTYAVVDGGADYHSPAPEVGDLANV